MRLRFCNVIIATLLMSSYAQAVDPVDSLKDSETQLFQEIATEEIAKQSTKEESKGDKLVEAKLVGGVFDEVSDGTNSRDVRPECDPHRFEDSVVGKRLTPGQYFRVTRAYFQMCGKDLSDDSATGIASLVKFSYMIYPFLSNPLVKKFTVTLADGTKVPGILALKEDPRPRPLVIMKCGVFCGAFESPSMKNYLMTLFDQTPFNVLMLANQTGMDYIYQNKRVSLGGWSEGYETLQVGKWMLENWALRDRISSLHLVGVSLGGNAAVMGAAFNDQLPLSNGKKIFNTVAAICPVVSLKPTLDKLYNSQIMGRAFYKTTKEHFVEARNYVKDVPDLLNDSKIPSSRSDMADFLGKIASASLERRGVASTPTSFFKSNNFWNLKNVVATPLLVWGSHDDMVVNNQINGQVVEYDTLYQNLDNVGAINLEYGNHCAFQTAYGARATAAVLRTYVLTHSPEFMADYMPKSTKHWDFGFKKLESHYVHVGQSWQFYSKSDQVKVTFRVFNKRGFALCGFRSPWSGAKSCIDEIDYWVPVSSFKAMGARVPKNTVDAQMLTRQFNTKVEFRINGSPLSGSNADDFFMTWRSYE